MTAPITSARVRELIAAFTASPRFSMESAVALVTLQTELADNANHIAKALDLWEKVQGGDAGLVEAMISTFFRTTALGAKHTGNVDQLVAQAMADETMRTSFVAALAALVGEVDHQALGGSDGRS